MSQNTGPQDKTNIRRLHWGCGKVTPEGWINVTNGPGDLQTEKQWADFVFQGECISNGKHLNSGIFFRCKDNEYQNGYEAQILNKFSPEPSATRPWELSRSASSKPRRCASFTARAELMY